ncbi:MAG: hypothetical protein Q8L12_15515 [Methylibium sp.]|nr:hypothetical protein [Methylibium sp.]
MSPLDRLRWLTLCYRFGDALRLAASLLDVPLPAGLAARYTEPGWA